MLSIEVHKRRRFHSDMLIGSLKEEKLEKLLTDSYMDMDGMCNKS